jgi:hypothetical protein
VELGYGRLAAVIGGLHPGVGANVIGARFKYFQRSGFPSDAMRVGKGWRVAYGVDDCMRLVFAFTLLSAGVFPAAAMELTTAEWAKIRRRLSEAWSEPGRKHALLVFVRLDGLGGGEGHGAIAPGTQDQLNDWLSGERGEDVSTTMLDAVRLAAKLREAVRKACPEREAAGWLEAADRWCLAVPNAD